METESEKYIIKNIRKIEDDLKGLRKNTHESDEKMRTDFNYHLKVYRENGKELAALKNEVANVDKNIESMKKMMTGLFHDQKQTIKENETRLQKLENWRWYLMGAFVVASTVAYILIQIILKKI
jgi:predicted  nucleic acid-binding Zn-ribbon protein